MTTILISTQKQRKLDKPYYRKDMFDMFTFDKCNGSADRNFIEGVCRTKLNLYNFGYKIKSGWNKDRSGFSRYSLEPSDRVSITRPSPIELQLTTNITIPVFGDITFAVISKKIVSEIYGLYGMFEAQWEVSGYDNINNLILLKHFIGSEAADTIYITNGLNNIKFQLTSSSTIHLTIASNYIVKVPIIIKDIAEGGLTFDGVDDEVLSEHMSETFPDYTVIVDREINKTGHGCIVRTAGLLAISQVPFIFEKYYSLGATWQGYSYLNRIHYENIMINKRDVSYQTTNSYNGTLIFPNPDKQYSAFDRIILGEIEGIRNLQFTIYKMAIYKSVLTEEEIQEEINKHFKQ